MEELGPVSEGEVVLVGVGPGADGGPPLAVGLAGERPSPQPLRTGPDGLRSGVGNFPASGLRGPHSAWGERGHGIENPGRAPRRCSHVGRMMAA